MVTLRFDRDDDGEPHYRVIEKEGKLRVIRQPWIESMSTDSWERISALLDTALSS